MRGLLALPLAAMLAAGVPATADETVGAASAIDGQRMDQTAPVDGFRYFSGHDFREHNHPAIYASGAGRRAHLTVVGHGTEQHFPLSRSADAIRAYQALLARQGYRTDR